MKDQTARRREVLRRIFDLQRDHDITDSDMVRGFRDWLYETSDSRGSIRQIWSLPMLEDETDLLLRALAAVCTQQGGTLNVSKDEMVNVDLDHFVGQPRIDESGIDFYFRARN